MFRVNLFLIGWFVLVQFDNNYYNLPFKLNLYNIINILKKIG